MKLFDGNELKTISSHIFDERGFRKNEKSDSNIFFIKTDYLDEFLKKHLPNYPFKLITHNSDYPITEKYIHHLENPNLLYWFAFHKTINHPKFKSVASGIANERENVLPGNLIEHFHYGSRKLFFEMIESNIPKTKLFANITFTVSTNYDERTKCQNICNSLDIPRVITSFIPYLLDLKKSMFCISPLGSVESHRTWECLHVKCVPIVVPKSEFAHYKKFPVMLINNWEELITMKFNEEVYRKYMENFKIEQLSSQYFLNEIINL